MNTLYSAYQPSFSFFIFKIQPLCVARGIFLIVTQPGMEPEPPELEV